MHTCMSNCNNLYQIKFESSGNIDLLAKNTNHNIPLLIFNVQLLR